MSSEPLTITAAAPLVRSGELTPSDLLEQCFRRIDIFEPAVKAWAYLDRERARQDAAKATDEIKAGNYRGPLHGIPIGIKDIIDVFDMPTGCGSKLWANSYARRDATCVERLRQAGAIILGKTVTTAYAYLDPPPTRNPWNLSRTPGGSSSGSAAAVACGMCLASLGTQTGGSTIRPASYCGVYSLKPTWGRVSVDGVLPLAPSLDHIGVMANCVRDLAVVFEVISGPTGYGRGWSASSAVPDCITRVDATDPPIPHIDRFGGHFDRYITPDMAALYDPFITRLDDALFDMDRVVTPAGFAEFADAHLAIMAAEAAEYHASRLNRHADDYPPEIRQLVEHGTNVPGAKLVAAHKLRDDLREQLEDMMSYDRFLITPATTSLPPDAATTGSPAFNSPWSFTGLPAISVPVGWTDSGLPYAIQLAGRRTYEDDLFGAAAWIERQFAHPHRLPPVPAA